MKAHVSIIAVACLIIGLATGIAVGALNPLGISKDIANLFAVDPDPIPDSLRVTRAIEVAVAESLAVYRPQIDSLRGEVARYRDRPAEVKTRTVYLPHPDTVGSDPRLDPTPGDSSFSDLLQRIANRTMEEQYESWRQFDGDYYNLGILIGSRSPRPLVQYDLMIFHEEWALDNLVPQHRKQLTRAYWGGARRWGVIGFALGVVTGVVASR